MIFHVEGIRQSTGQRDRIEVSAGTFVEAGELAAKMGIHVLDIAAAGQPPATVAPPAPLSHARPDLTDSRSYRRHLGVTRWLGLVIGVFLLGAGGATAWGYYRMMLARPAGAMLDFAMAVLLFSAVTGLVMVIGALRARSETGAVLVRLMALLAIIWVILGEVMIAFFLVLGVLITLLGSSPPGAKSGDTLLWLLVAAVVLPLVILPGLVVLRIYAIRLLRDLRSPGA